jgi:hypothetical protein
MRLDFEGMTMPNIGKELLSSHKKVNVSTSLWMELKLKLFDLQWKELIKVGFVRKGDWKGLTWKEVNLKRFSLKGNELENLKWFGLR